MAQGQFLIRNRHCNQWHGRVIIPKTLREHFNGKREFRRSLKTSDKTTVKRRALEFWVEWKNGFERIEQEANDPMRYIETHDALERKHVFDLDNPKDEQKLAREMHENANKFLAKFADNPEVLERLLAINDNTLNETVKTDKIQTTSEAL